MNSGMLIPPGPIRVLVATKINVPANHARHREIVATNFLHVRTATFVAHLSVANALSGLTSYVVAD
jgi:hypothetical protein